MDRTKISITVYFEEPFWVGLFERTEDDRLSVCKITYGPEPKDYEVLSFIQDAYGKLFFSPSIQAEEQQSKHCNPKRMQREVRRQLDKPACSTKFQLALSIAREEQKAERKAKSKDKRDEEKERLYELKRQQRKQKHKGR